MTTDTDERGRITARMPLRVQETLERAADLVGASVNQFVVQAALAEAERVFERERIINLSRVDSEFLLSLLEKAPKPNRLLSAALRDYNRRRLDDSHSAFEWTPRPRGVRVRK